MANDVELVNALIREDRHDTVSYIADKLYISCHLHSPSSIRARGITELLQDGCQSSCQMNMNGCMWKCACSVCSHIMKGEGFLQLIVTDNEMWVHHYEHASKCQSVEWKYMSFPRTKKIRSVPSAGKVMLILFWDFNGLILQHFKDHGQMVNSAWYCAMLKRS